VSGERVPLPPELALPGFGTVLFTTPDEWLAAVRSAGDEVTRAVDEAVAEAARRIERMDDSALTALGFVVSVPLGAVLASRSDEAKDELRRALAAAAREVNAELQRLWAAVAHQTENLFGHPDRLVELGNSYLAARVSVDGAAELARSEGLQLARHWSGLGARAFNDASTGQVFAMTEAGLRLERASALMGEAAQAIKHTWSDLLQSLLGLAASIVDTIASAFDAGNILTFGAGPVVSLVATAISFVNDVAAPIRSMNSSAETLGALRWAAVAGSSSWFEGGVRWPSVDPQDVHAYDDAGRWSL
jgi:hypothetical protein